MAGDAVQTLPIRVKFYGIIRDVVDGPQVELQLPQNSTVNDLLRSLADRYGDKFVERVFNSQGDLKTYVRVFINNQEVAGNFLTTRLVTEGESAEALVYVLPATTGG